MPDLSKQSDKVLAKFARRASTMRQVLVACGLNATDIDAAIVLVKSELLARGVKWESSSAE